MAIEELKLTTGSKLKAGPIHNTKTRETAMNSRLIRPQTRHRNPENTYLNP
jgi:hypothetical protein